MRDIGTQSGRLALADFLYSRGKYFRLPDPGGLRRLSRLFDIPEEDVRDVLQASGFTLVLRFPIAAYWLREEILPERSSD